MWLEDHLMSQNHYKYVTNELTEREREPLDVVREDWWVGWDLNLRGMYVRTP